MESNDPYSTPPPRRKQATNEVSLQKLHDCLDDDDDASPGRKPPPRTPNLVSTPSPWGTAAASSTTEIARTIPNVLSPHECSALIERAESIGFGPALFNNLYLPEARNSDRVVVEDPDFCRLVYQRLQECLPRTRRLGSATYMATGLNERLRILRYQPGHVFPAHSDGCYQRPDGSEISFCTIMMYLNQDFTGGRTLFLPHPLDERNASEPPMILGVAPQPGLVVCFDHPVLHEGALVTQGVKYAIRTDLMFAKKEE